MILYALIALSLLFLVLIFAGAAVQRLLAARRHNRRGRRQRNRMRSIDLTPSEAETVEVSAQRRTESARNPS